LEACDRKAFQELKRKISHLLRQLQFGKMLSHGLLLPKAQQDLLENHFHERKMSHSIERYAK
jgi:hypothetical protein